MQTGPEGGGPPRTPIETLLKPYRNPIKTLEKPYRNLIKTHLKLLKPYRNPIKGKLLVEPMKTR